MTYFTSDAGTFDFIALRDAGVSRLSFQDIAYPLMFLGFGTLAAVFPLHNWSPDGHVAAPTAVSMLHAGVLMKLGAYGVLRYGIELFPQGAVHWGPVAATMAAGRCCVRRTGCSTANRFEIHDRLFVCVTHGSRDVWPRGRNANGD